jgi:hypothetical protein
MFNHDAAGDDAVFAVERNDCGVFDDQSLLHIGIALIIKVRDDRAVK